MKENNSDRIREMYDAAAANYTHWVVDPGSFNMLAEIPYVHDLLGVVLGKRVLDLGCGPGQTAVFLAGRGADVVGLDFSKRMIDVGRDEAVKAGVKVDFRVGDARDLSAFKVGEFDGVVSVSTVDYLPDVHALFRDLARVLRPGGWFIFSAGHPIREAGGEIEDSQGRYGRTVFNYFQHDTTQPFTWPDVVREDGRPFTTLTYARTIQDYVDALADSGFLVERLLEPPPVESAKTTHPDAYRKLICCPQFMIFKAVPRATGAE